MTIGFSFFSFLVGKRAQRNKSFGSRVLEHQSGKLGQHFAVGVEAAHALPPSSVFQKLRRTKSFRSGLCSALATRLRRRLPRSSTVLRMAAGERVADGDIARTHASAVSRA